MNRLSSLGLCVALAVVAPQGWAQSVVPLKGQSTQQTQTDITECQNIAAGQTTSSTPSGGRIKGAAAGAAAGATAAQIRGRQHDEFYDRVDDDTKQYYRQDRARQTAAAGAVVGGSRQRQERRAQRNSNEAASATAYSGCLQGKGYQVNP